MAMDSVIKEGIKQARHAVRLCKLEKVLWLGVAAVALKKSFNAKETEVRGETTIEMVEGYYDEESGE